MPNTPLPILQIPSSGLFVTFEGIDGCGKTTQLQMMEQWFRTHHYPVQSTRQPGGTAIGQQIREIVLSQVQTKLVPQSELLLYLADRIQHLHEKVLPALKQGQVILCDRFHDATVAYQGYGRQLDLKGIQDLVDQWITPYFPHFTILLEISPKISLMRLKKRQNEDPEESQDRLEQESIHFFQRVAEGYTTLAEHDPERFIRVDASQSIEDVHEEIIQKFLEKTKHLK